MRYKCSNAQLACAGTGESWDPVAQCAVVGFVDSSKDLMFEGLIGGQIFLPEAMILRVGSGECCNDSSCGDFGDDGLWSWVGRYYKSGVRECVEDCF